MSKAQTKKELAEAGRRKLEAFRKQKAEKKQPGKAALPDEALTIAASSTRTSKAGPEPVSLPVGNDIGLSQQHSGAPPPRGISSGKAGGGTATPPASVHVPGPSVAQNGHTMYISGSSPQQPWEPANARDEDSAPAEALPAHGNTPAMALPADSDAPAARQRTARSLFNAGLPAPPPLPLPPTPSSRPAWMNARAAVNSSIASPQLKVSKQPILEDNIPVGGTHLAAIAVAHVPEAEESAARVLTPAALAEPPIPSLAAPTITSNGTDNADPALLQRSLSSKASHPQSNSAADSPFGQQHEQALSYASPARTKETPAAVLQALQARAERRVAGHSLISMPADEEDTNTSWDALLARPLPAHAPQQPAQEQAASSAPVVQRAQGSAAAADHVSKAAQPGSTSSDVAAGYASLSDVYASSQELHPSDRSSQAAPSAGHGRLSDAHASSMHASPQRSFPKSSPAADYAHLSDEYLGGSAGPGVALSGPPPGADAVGTQVNSLSSGIPSSSHGYAALSDSYLSPPSLEPRISGALPVSSNAAMGPPSHSTLDPIEQRQLGALPASRAAASMGPSHLALHPSAQSRDASPQPQHTSRNAAGGPDKGVASLWSGGTSQLDVVQSTSAAPPRSLFCTFRHEDMAGSRQGSPLRRWHEPMGPPPSSFQLPSWITSDSKQESLSRMEQSIQNSSGPGLHEITNGDSRPSELSNGHTAGGLKSAAANGIPPRRSWSRETWENRGPAAPSPPVSVRGTASEEGFSASEGQMKRFKALQQHIDELTQEKYELMRGLATQRKVQESLEAESERFASDFNRQAQHTQALQAQLEQLSAEVAAQRLALTGATRERDGARAAAVETSERLGRLAAEVVELEEKALKAKSEELKREREAAAEREAARRAQAAAKAAQQEREILQSILDTLEEEKRALHVKLRRAMLGEHLREEQGSKEASTQTDRLPDEAGSPPPFRTQASAQTPCQRAHSVLQSQPREDPSVQIAAEAMQAFRAEPAPDSAPGTLPEAVLQLLPRNLYTGGLAGVESDVAADEAAALSNIHGLLDLLESQRQSVIGSLDAAEAENRKLASANKDLSQRLESAQQRLELAISRSQHASATPPSLPPPAHPAAAAAAEGPSPSPQAPLESRRGHRAEDVAGAQLVMHSAPNTPAQSSRQLLRAPKGGEPRQSTLGWFVDLLVPPSQDFQRFGPLT